MVPKLWLKDRSTGKTIDIGRESQGLYHLTSPSSPGACISTMLLFSFTVVWDKLSAKAYEMHLLGYSRLQKGYCCYSPNTHRYFLSADVIFFEDSPFFSSSESLPISEVLPLPYISPPSDALSCPLQVYHRRHCAVAPPFSSVEVPDDSPPVPTDFSYPTVSSVDHLPIALRKVTALHSNGTWDLVSLPLGKSTVGCCWVYTVKVGPDGQVDRLKARLVLKVIRRFMVVTMVTPSLLLPRLLLFAYFSPWQLCVIGLFIRGVWFSVQVTPLSIWLETVSSGMLGVLVQLFQEFGMFRSNDQEGIQRLKQHIFNHFQTKDLGKLKYFLGLEIAQSSLGVVMSQRKYALDILEETSMLECKHVDTPMDPNVKLVPGQGEPLRDLGRYRRLVGKLNYLTIIRPEHLFSRELGQGMLYEDRGHTQILGYTDADWVGSPSDRRSTSGFLSLSFNSSKSNCECSTKVVVVSPLTPYKVIVKLRSCPRLHTSDLSNNCHRHITDQRLRHCSSTSPLRSLPCHCPLSVDLILTSHCYPLNLAIVPLVSASLLPWISLTPLALPSPHATTFACQLGFQYEPLLSKFGYLS
ncbi:Retrovirus-related Pol polyprotein from transposon RE1 [Vitis vinifera]|uniref:Retrovirus-related Pol polyprotein from transposon RE1 n=1 Tax=Vitis vinifera TaxID=29760 RepID=A0A438EDH8_VITVI|nr:Retrovirus-related Pol polyprotein from transposon RE1 [Vitis vinifera]